MLNRKRIVGLGIAVTLLAAGAAPLVVPDAGAQPADASPNTTYEPSPAGAGTPAARWLHSFSNHYGWLLSFPSAFYLSIYYGGFKTLYALGGGLAGGSAYLLSGLDLDTAKSIWTPSLYGDYIIWPEQLRGERPLHFIGQAETQSAIEAP